MWATAGPRTFDCSGFTYWVASQVLGPLDYELRSSHHQFNVWGEPVKTPIAGDLVFFDVGQGVIMGNKAGHVGLMIDADRFIHAANETSGVIVSELAGEWYAPRFIGARRIFEHAPGPHAGDAALLPDIDTGRDVVTRNPWNGGVFGVTWAAVYQWRREIEAAAAAEGANARQLAVLMMVETQGIHERDGEVLSITDNFPEDGPSVGLMQVKPQIWGKLRPKLDAYEPADNIRLGAAVLASLIDKYGDFFTAIAKGYHPADAPNGTTPNSYVESVRGLLGELANG